MTASGLVAPSFTASVSATNFTTTGGQIAKNSISYWSGPATATSGLHNAVPGQATAAQAEASP